MRKKWIVIWIVLPTILLLTALTSFANHRITTGLTQSTQEIESSIRAGDWATAQDQAAQFQEDWDQVRRLLQVWINHEDTDAVTLDVLDLIVLVQCEDSMESLRRLANLRETLNHLCHRDSLTLWNLL